MREIPKEMLEKMSTENMQVHAHNWVCKGETFNSFKSLVDTFDVIAIDDATPQGMKEEECKDFTEFPLIY